LSSGEMRKLSEEPPRKTIRRKLVHITLALMLLIPLTPAFVEGGARLMSDPYLVPLITYVVLAIGAAFVNSLQIKMPHYREWFLSTFRDLRKRYMSQLRQVASKSGSDVLAKQLSELDKLFDRVEDRLTKLISELERDYEKRYGYVAITFALLSIALSYALYGPIVAYGILALAVVDGLTAILTKLLPRPRVIKHSAPSLSITFAVFAAILACIGCPPALALALSAIAVVVEVLSPEDNLTLPIIVATAAYFLRAPPIPFLYH